MEISHEYVKESFGLSWRFFSKNKKLSLISMVLVFVLPILIFVFVLAGLPLLAFICLIAFGAFTLSIQTYISKVLIHAKNNDEFDEIVRSTSLRDLFFKCFSVGAGTFFSSIVINLLVASVSFSLFYFLIGFDAWELFYSGHMPRGDQYSFYMMLALVGSIIALVVMTLVYLFPLAIAKSYETDDFTSAFGSVFTIFNPQTWKRSSSEKYFVLISVMQVVFVLVVSLSLPFMITMILMPLAAWFNYLFLVYFSISATLAREFAYEHTNEKLFY